MPKPEHVPTKATRQLVEMHTAIGTPQEVIADILEIDPKTLRKHYRRDLDLATARANAAVGGALFNKAIKGDTTAMIFWLKTKGGFKEFKEDLPPEQNITVNIIDAVKNAN